MFGKSKVVFNNKPSLALQGQVKVPQWNIIMLALKSLTKQHRNATFWNSSNYINVHI